jgi:hypothetical protein
MAYIRSQTVVVRPNPKLPSDSKIQYPYNLELQFVQETWSKKQIKEEKDEMVTLQEQDQDFEKFEADFEKALLPTASSAASGGTGPSSSGHIGPAEVPKPMNEESNQQIEKTKVAIQALRKGHSGWDRAKRDWQGS